MTLSRRALLFALAFFPLSCSLLPWSGEKRETAVAFTMQHGLPVIDARLGGRPGAFVVSSAHPRTLVREPAEGRQSVELGNRLALPVTPLQAKIQTHADGILGTDVWSRGGTLTVEYARGLITIGRSSDFRNLETQPFRDVPAVPILVNGTPMMAVVDTSFPGGLLLPDSARSQVAGGNGARVEVARTDLSSTVHFADVPGPRIGNEILRHFVVMIDYERGRVAFWRDPR